MRPFVADSDDLTDEVIDDAGGSTPAAVAKTLSIGRQEIARGRLARQARIIKIPLLVVAGEDDQIVDPQSVGVWAGGVDRAEICLIDECGHLPMIERVGEFNAQILAFLTGDARYLDYARPAPEPAEAPAVEEGAEVHYLNGDAPPETTASSDDTVDLAPGPAEPDADDSVPNVVRKQDGRYPARYRPPGAEESSQPAEQPSGARTRREPADDHFLPELPDDLFDWPETRREFRTGERHGDEE